MAPTPVPDPRRETDAERLDRNFDELLQELRVSQAGVQILFAFLLGVSFTTPFRAADSFVHIVYAVTLLLALDDPLGRPAALTLAGGAFVVLAGLWVVLPLRLRAKRLH